MPSARMEISLLLEQLGEASPGWLVASCDQPCGQHTAAPLPTRRLAPAPPQSGFALSTLRYTAMIRSQDRGHPRPPGAVAGE